MHIKILQNVFPDCLFYNFGEGKFIVHDVSKCILTCFLRNKKGMRNLVNVDILHHIVLG